MIPVRRQKPEPTLLPRELQSLSGRQADGKIKELGRRSVELAREVAELEPGVAIKKAACDQAIATVRLLEIKETAAVQAEATGHSMTIRDVKAVQDQLAAAREDVATHTRAAQLLETRLAELRKELEECSTTHETLKNAKEGARVNARLDELGKAALDTYDRLVAVLLDIRRAENEGAAVGLPAINPNWMKGAGRCLDVAAAGMQQTMPERSLLIRNTEE